MEVSVGDKVRFLNDVGGGIVTKVLDKRNVMIMNEFDFEVPAAISDIIVVEEAVQYVENETTTADSASSNSGQAEIVVDTKDIFYPEVAEVAETGNDIHVQLAFVPQGRPGNSDLNVFLINDSNYNMLYSIINKEAPDRTYSNTVGVLEANMKEQIETLLMSSVNTLPEYIFQLTFYKKNDFKVVDPVNKALKINPVKFYKESSYKENDFFDEDSIVFTIANTNQLANEIESLSEKELTKIIREKEKVEQKVKPVSRKEKEQQIIEVDLHIHELLDDFRGLTNGEIMEVQMDHFKSQLDDAFKKRVKKIVFIHGVGNGSLKMEIRQALDKMGKKVTYQDASFQEYGYGATMVQLKI